jgi:hypothetical protein
MRTRTTSVTGFSEEVSFQIPSGEMEGVDYDKTNPGPRIGLSPIPDQNALSPPFILARRRLVSAMAGMVLEGRLVSQTLGLDIASIHLHLRTSPKQYGSHIVAQSV